MVAEFLYRAITAGFYGALTQAFGEVEPEWAAGIAVSVLLPLYISIVRSVCFTVVSTLFNQYAISKAVGRTGIILRPSPANRRAIALSGLS